MGNAEPILKKEEKKPQNDIVNRQPMLEGSLVRVQNPNIQKKFDLDYDKTIKITGQFNRKLTEGELNINFDGETIILTDSNGKIKEFEKTVDRFKNMLEYIKQEYGIGIFNEFMRWANDQIQKLQNEQKKAQPESPKVGAGSGALQGIIKRINWAKEHASKVGDAEEKGNKEAEGKLAQPVISGEVEQLVFTEDGVKKKGGGQNKA